MLVLNLATPKFAAQLKLSFNKMGFGLRSHLVVTLKSDLLAVQPTGLSGFNVLALNFCFFVVVDVSFNNFEPKNCRFRESADDNLIFKPGKPW
jgi:hypothetical protein